MNNPKSSIIRGLVLVLAIFIASNISLLAQTQTTKFWLAGRYDGNRVIVYFNAVKFDGTLPADAKAITTPVADGFFSPVELSPAYIAQFLKQPDAESFVLGDKYDLLLGHGRVVTITLTKLVGAEGDEGTGNDSFIGALATSEKNDDLIFLAENIYVVRRHQAVAKDKTLSIPNPKKKYAGLETEPVRFDIQMKIVDLITQQMKSMTTGTERLELEHLPPVFQVQAFHLANGELRYYAQAAWDLGRGPKAKTLFGVAAWISSSPTLHIVATEKRTTPYDNGVEVTPHLVNVVDLDGGKTGIVVSETGNDSESIDLLEYRDGGQYIPNEDPSIYRCRRIKADRIDFARGYSQL